MVSRCVRQLCLGQMFCSCSYALDWIQQCYEPRHSRLSHAQTHLCVTSFGTHSPSVCLWVSFGWVLLEQGFSERVPRAFRTDACSHVSGLVSEEDYGICHSDRKYERRTCFGHKGMCSLWRKAGNRIRAPVKIASKHCQGIWTEHDKLGSPFLVGFHCVFLAPSFSSKSCSLELLLNLLTPEPGSASPRSFKKLHFRKKKN